MTPTLPLPDNRFLRALRAGTPQIGLWCALGDAYAAEIVAGAGFDWLLLDGEHGPSEVESMLAQLQAVAPYPATAVVRPASNDPVRIKRCLDIGAQSLLVPYVESAEEARRAVAAVRYPPGGIRGVAGLTRASRFGRVPGYLTGAPDELCLLVQVETARALHEIEAIAAVDGVDGIFIGPSDLSASLGRIGELAHPDVVAAVEGALRRVVRAGVPAGILTADDAEAERCLGLGATFVAVGLDVGLLARGADRLADRFARWRP